MRWYPEVYEAIRAAAERDVARGVMSRDAMEAHIRRAYSDSCWAISRGYETEEEAIQEFSLWGGVGCEVWSQAISLELYVTQLNNTFD